MPDFEFISDSGKLGINLRDGDPSRGIAPDPRTVNHTWQAHHIIMGSATGPTKTNVRDAITTGYAAINRDFDINGAPLTDVNGPLTTDRSPL